jgi:hypothetical protein
MDAAAAAAIAVVLHAVFRGGIPTNDSWHTLIWGRELASGLLPDYQAPFAPTPHPLQIVYAAALSPLGVAEPALQLAGVVAVGAIAVGLFRLGTRLYAWPVGLLAAVILLTRDRLLYYGARGSVDAEALALILWAAVLEAGRPRRGWPVLVLLALAGLLRPESWVFAAAYWVWLFPARDWKARAGLAALAASAPVLWALSDLLVTGDPLWSLHGTQGLAGALDRRTGLAAVPDSSWRSFKALLTPPLLIAGVGGLAAGLALRARATLLPAAILALQGAAFVSLAVLNLPLNQRYLLPAALVLSLLAGVAGLGWIGLPPGDRARTVWRAAGLLTLVLIAATVALQLPTVASVRSKLLARQTIGSDLPALLETDAVQRALAVCGPLVAPSNFRRPQIAYLTNRSEESVGVALRGTPPERGVYVRATTRRETTNRVNRYVPTSFKDFVRDVGPPDARPPRGYSQLARGRFWIAYSRCQPPTAQRRTSRGTDRRIEGGRRSSDGDST